MAIKYEPNALLRLPSVQAQSALSKSEIYRRIKAGNFPKPVKLGARAVAWRYIDVEAWIHSLSQDVAK